MLHDSTVSLLRLYTTELCAYILQKTEREMVMAVLVVIVQTGIFSMLSHGRMGT